jgi:hypothetical protein
MEAVRLTDGQEHSTVERNEIAALLDALCEHPLADGDAEPSPELAAVCREATKALTQAGAAPSDTGAIVDPDRLRAALATLLSDADVEGAHRTVVDAMLNSAAARLDAQSALAFLESIAQSPRSAPAHLVDQVLAPETARRTGSADQRGHAALANIWRLVAGGSWAARRWRAAAACALLLIAGSATMYRIQTSGPIESDAQLPAAGVLDKSATGAEAPATPQPELATAKPCEPHGAAGEVVLAKSKASPERPIPESAAAVPDCTPSAEADPEAIEALATRARVDAARRAAAARRDAKRAPPSGSTLFGASDRNIPAARTLPAAPPAASPTPPR